jgi:hypothetical protein
MRDEVLGRDGVALDSEPLNTERAEEPRSWRQTIALCLQGIGEGRALHHHYERLVARGVPPNRAGTIAFEKTFAQRCSERLPRP